MRTAKFLDSEQNFVVRTNPSGADFRAAVQTVFLSPVVTRYEWWAHNAKNGDIRAIYNEAGEVSGYVEIEEIEV